MKCQEKFDLEVFLFIESLKLKLEEDKVYSPSDVPLNLVYDFQSEEEFMNYFIENGLSNINLVSLNRYKLKMMSSGKVLALKKLCDSLIKRKLEGDKNIPSRDCKVLALTRK